tara:strand:+ start:1953 stop:2387 length:435 start_codon:yes stop_codon:yes gene_type:complete
MTLIKPKRYEDKLVLPKLKKPDIPMTQKEREEYLKILPNPTGYRVLVKPYVPKDKTDGGIFLSDQTQETMEVSTVVGLVIKMGDLCYKDKTKFPNGSWCKKGQFVIYGRYAGARFKTKYGEHRILNDDEIIGTIEKPEDILALF